MARSATVACVVLASACGNKQDAPAPATGSASASGAANDPWAKPAPSAPAPGSAAVCDDAAIRQRIQASLGVSMTYMNLLVRKSQRWGKDCEQVKQDLLALEPEATRFMAAMTEFMEWGRTLDATCGQRVKEIGEALPEAREIEKNTPALEQKVEPILERCKDHPGFQEAAAKGLRVLRKSRRP